MIDLIKIEHIDFTLTVKCNNIESTFNKAQKKQTNIFEATTYLVNKGQISIYNYDESIRNFDESLREIHTGENVHPLFFENKDYLVWVGFKEKERIIGEPKIYSRLKDVVDKFHYQKNDGVLVGSLNFGNDLGKTNLTFRYNKDDKSHEINFQFEVFPTKLDYRKDYLKIVQDIEKEYPLLVLDFLKKTYSSFKTGSSENTNLIWWKVFGGLYSDFIKSAKFILNKPHSRIIRQTRFVNADKIKKWTPALEEQFAQFKKIPDKKYRTEYKLLSTNTPENRFFKHAILKTYSRYKNVKSHILKNFQDELTDDFIKELEELETELKTISGNPFFRNIDSFNGIKQESLVLQKASGYSTVYKCWIMLNRGLKFLDGIQKIELKHIAELYEIWCFLEIKKVLQKILGKEPYPNELAEIKVDNFKIQFKEGHKSKLSFEKENGELIVLYHEYKYKKNHSSFTTDQEPDIVLEITKSDLRDKYVLTYLFDAKYRLNPVDKSNGNDNKMDLPPVDAIDQMHRYRDAIYYKNKNKRRDWKENESLINYFPEKEVIGGYILYPGVGSKDQIIDNPFYKSIDEVNIGAFPLRPNDEGNTTFIEEHLKNIINTDTENILKEVSPQKGSKYQVANPIVLVGIVPSEERAKCFEEGQEKPFYYTGQKKPSQFGFDKLKYFAPYIKGKGIKEYFEILDYRIIQRKDIFEKTHPLFKNENDERLLINLGNRFKIDIDNGKYFKLSDGNIRKPYRYTKLSSIRKPQNGKIKV